MKRRKENGKENKVHYGKKKSGSKKGNKNKKKEVWKESKERIIK